MAIIEHFKHNPCDDPDDYRRNSTWAIACDPKTSEAPYVHDMVVTVDIVGAGEKVPMHTHPIDEIVFIEDGIVEAVLGTETRTIGRGSVAFIPAGTPHGGRVTGEASARFLGVFPSSVVGIEMLERIPAPGTEGDPLPPPFTLDVRKELDS